MPINYLRESEIYRPDTIKTLLVGEAPPPNGESYFYVPQNPNNNRLVRDDRSLPATVFNHYFGRRQNDEKEYRTFLFRLKKEGVFLVDIFDQPIAVRGSEEGLATIVTAIPKLKAKLQERGIDVGEDKMVFLLARNNYKRHIRTYFPRAHLVNWIDFRLNGEDRWT